MTIHDADMHRPRQWWLRTVRSGFGYAQVWHKTRHGIADPLYGRQVTSALFWTFGVASVAAAAAALLGPLGLTAAPLLWFVQFVRLARRGGGAWAMHMLAGKFAEAQGILRYLRARIAGRRQGAIFYK